MKKKLRVTAYIVGGAFVFAVTGTALFLYFGVPALAESGFRKDFSPDQSMFTVNPDFERALAFGGRLGLSRLERLSQDTTIAPAGRAVAVHLVKYIESGQHVVDMRREFTKGNYPAPME